jgi:tetratricopeptide (TPR) repeat protein
MQLDPNDASPRLHLAGLLIHQDQAAARTLLQELLQQDGNNKGGHHLLAQLEASSGNHDRALQLYRRLCEIDPGDAQAVYMTGLFMLQKGEVSEGEKIADEMLKRWPKLPFGALLKGLARFQRDDLSGAVADLQTSLQSGESLLAYYFLGLSYYRLEKLELALNQFQKMIDLRPDSIKARLMVATTLLRQQRVDDAVTEVKRVLQLDPENGAAYNLLGSAWMSQGKVEEAMTAFDRATELDPALIDAHLKKGLFHASKGELPEAEEEIVAALDAAPEILDTRMLLATHYLRQKNFTAAEETLKEGLGGKSSDAILYNYLAASSFARKDPEAAVDYLQRAKKVDPDFYAAYYNLASYYAAQRKYDSALEEYGVVLEKNPGDLKALVQSGLLYELSGKEEQALTAFLKAREIGKAEGAMALAQYHLGKKRNESALQVLEEARKSYPAELGILEYRGKVLLNLNRYEEAERIFGELENVAPGRGEPFLVETYLRSGNMSRAESLAREMTEREPASAQGFLLLAQIHERQKGLDKALEVLRKGLSGNPGDPRIPLRIGGIHERKGELERARKVYEDILEKFPRYHPSLFALGAIDDRLGNRQLAERRYREVLKVAANFTPALNNLAYVLAENGNKEEALELAMRAYRNEPGNPGIADTLGYVLLKNGRAEEACQLLEKAAAGLPDNPTVCYHLALSYQEVGKRGEAAEWLKKALTLGDFPEMKQAQALLKKANLLVEGS